MADDDKLSQVRTWLEGALRAERQALDSELERRHSLLLKECEKLHSASFGDTRSAQQKPAGVTISAEEREVKPLEQWKKNGVENQGQKSTCRCGNLFLDDAIFCRKCGHARPGICTCGNVLGVDALFCKKCGKPVEDEEEAQEEQGNEAAQQSESESPASVRRAPSIVADPWAHQSDRSHLIRDNSCNRLHIIVLHPYFEITFALLIVLNTVTMAFESQYHGIVIGHNVKYPRYNGTSEDIWPGAKIAFIVLDWFFGIIFTIEVLMKAFGLCRQFHTDWWNLFDVVIVGAWLIDALARDLVTFPIDPMLLRLARLARLLRLLKLIKSLQGIDPLFLMVTTLKGSISVLLWAFLFLLVCQTMFAFLLNQILVSYYLEEDNDAATKLEIFKYFGTFSRSILSMFEITLGNWVPVARLLLDGVSEWFMIFSLLHKLTMGFAVISVINGIFIQETFKVAACDDTLMMMQTQRATRTHSKKMKVFFDAADTSLDGCVDLPEFRSILENPQVIMWLKAQQLDASDGDSLFMLMDNGSHKLTVEDFVKGVSRLKGDARSFDLRKLMHQHQHQFDLLQKNVDFIRRQMLSANSRDGHTPAPHASTMEAGAAGSPAACSEALRTAGLRLGDVHTAVADEPTKKFKKEVITF